LEAGSQSLSITTFRFVPRDLLDRKTEDAVAAYLEELNVALLDRIQRSGDLFLSHAVVRGRTLLRACIVNFHTSDSDIEAIPEIAAQMGRELDAEMRGDRLR
jgi:hypothetical protein